MAVKNRTEAITEVNTKIVPTVTNTIHKDLLNNDILNSVVYRKDVIGSETPSGGNVVIDYTNKETATVSTSSSLSVSFTNIENGDVRYLRITKSAANTISFSGATNATNFQKYINTKVSAVTYQVFNKNGVIVVSAILATIIEGTLSDIEAADPYKFPTAKAVYDLWKNQGAWTNITLATGWSGTARYRINDLTGKIEMWIAVIYGAAGTSTLANISASIAPAPSSMVFAVGVGGFLNPVPSLTKLRITASPAAKITVDVTNMTPGAVDSVIEADFSYYKDTPPS